MWIHNYLTDIFFIRHQMSADGSNSLLAINSENVNLSLQVATPLSRLIYPFGGYSITSGNYSPFQGIIPSFEKIMLSYQ